MSSHAVAAVAALADTQYGLVTREQAIAAGMSPAAIKWRLRTGQWACVYRGAVYRIVGATSSWHQAVLAAVLAGGAGAVASHRTAAALHGFEGYRQGPVEITVPRGRRFRAPAGVIVHTTEVLDRIDVEVVAGIPTTTPQRTLVMLGAVVDVERVENALDAARRDGKVRLPSLRWRHDEVRERGRDGCGVIAPLLERKAANGIAQTRRERRVARMAEQLGFPSPVLQYRVHERGRHVARLDGAWPWAKRGFEVDGDWGHSTRLDRDRDARKRAELARLGWELAVVTNEQVDHDPAFVATVLRHLLRDLPSPPRAA